MKIHEWVQRYDNGDWTALLRVEDGVGCLGAKDFGEVLDQSKRVSPPCLLVDLPSPVWIIKIEIHEKILASTVESFVIPSRGVDIAQRYGMHVMIDVKICDRR
jgi:hypothetical protein